MRSLTLVVLAFFCAGASATTYYVDPAGSNANDGLSPQTAWRTLLKVGVSTFSPGDMILFKRDAVWNEWLTPPSSGTAGNLIKFDAYGNGRPPEFTGQYATTSSQWSNGSGNVWQITLTATQAIAQLKFVQFGSIWGNSQTSQGGLAHNRDWYYDNVTQILYVYSSAGNPVTAFASVTPIILSAQSLINLNGVSYIEIQHIRLDWYDGYGVQVQGASDHIWLANMSADSQVPNATVPIGFYVHPSGTPGDIHLYNTDAHRNYVGYRFDGTPAAVELKNCRAYANRTYGLMDNTAAVTYSYCHFYANNLATGISTDTTGTPGPINGGNNIAADTLPNVRGFMLYPARITLTYDDPGLIDGSHEYLQALLPMFQAKSFPLSIAVVTGYPLSQQLVPTFQSWINGGWDLNAHSVSHQYFVFPNAFTLQYTGTAASSVTLSIANNQFVITAPGDPNAQVSWDLTSSGTDLVPSGLDTLGGLIFTLNQRGVFSVTADSNMKSAVKSEDLAGAAHPAGSGLGGAQLDTNVRIVLEVHDIDSANPATLVAPATVLYDGVLSGAPAFCTYALVNSPGLQCAIAFTRFIQAADTEVRSALPDQSYRTRLVGPLSSGGECNIYSGPTLDFFSQHVPASNEVIEVHYRGLGRAMARVTNPASIAAEQRGADDGTRGVVRHLKLPPARTSVDCENAALALLADAAIAGWTGRYETWSDFLPGNIQDIFPGDAINLNISSRAALFQAIASEVQIKVHDLRGEHMLYQIQLVAAIAEELAFEFDATRTTAALNLTPVSSSQVGTTVLPDLIAAAITLVNSTTADLDAGTAPPAGGGIEVRWSDFGWGAANDQNLAGRFTAQTFTLPRLAKAQDYFLRQFDTSVPPKYSRFSAALHIDFPY